MPSWQDKIRIKWNKFLDNRKSKKVTLCKSFVYQNIPCREYTIKPFDYCEYHYRIIKIQGEAYHLSNKFDRSETKQIAALIEHQQRLRYQAKQKPNIIEDNQNRNQILANEYKKIFDFDSSNKIRETTIETKIWNKNQLLDYPGTSLSETDSEFETYASCSETLESPTKTILNCEFCDSIHRKTNCKFQFARKTFANAPEIRNSIINALEEKNKENFEEITTTL